MICHSAHFCHSKRFDGKACDHAYNCLLCLHRALLDLACNPLQYFNCSHFEIVILLTHLCTSALGKE